MSDIKGIRFALVVTASKGMKLINLHVKKTGNINTVVKRKLYNDYSFEYFVARIRANGKLSIKAFNRNDNL